MATRTPKEITEQIKSLNLEAREQQEVGELKRPQLEPTDTGTRQKIAKYFVFAYFLILGILIIGIPAYNIAAFKVTYTDNPLLIPLSDTIQTYSAIVGPTLGFVIAYYFKSKNEN